MKFIFRFVLEFFFYNFKESHGWVLFVFVLGSLNRAFGRFIDLHRINRCYAWNLTGFFKNNNATLKEMCTQFIFNSFILIVVTPPYRSRPKKIKKKPTTYFYEFKRWLSVQNLTWQKAIYKKKEFKRNNWTIVRVINLNDIEHKFFSLTIQFLYNVFQSTSK